MSESSGKMILPVYAIATFALILAITGLVLPEPSEIPISDLNGVNITNPTEGQALIYNSTLASWVNLNLTSVKVGRSSPFNTTNTGLQNATLLFSANFTTIPNVVLSLNSISNSSVVIANVQTFNVTISGFDASALITTGGNGTAIFSYVAVD